MATSLASSVGTRVESASRHMLQCRVHKDRYLSWNVDNETLRRNKHQFSMTKDELVVDTASSMFPARDHICKQPHPYPRVVTSWRGFDHELMSIYCFMMSLNTRDFFEFKKFMENPHTPMLSGGVVKRVLDDHEELSQEMFMKKIKQIHTMPDFRVMGYSVGTAYAHEYNGDTIASVMIGGLATVQNGRYPMATGDPICWYVQYAEESYFDEYGKRDPKKVIMHDKMSMNRPTGKQGHSMRNSGFGDPSLKDKVFLPKPFFYNHASFGDTRRIFAKCLSNAAPFEKVDIMIASQSI